MQLFICTKFDSLHNLVLFEFAGEYSSLTSASTRRSSDNAGPVSWTPSPTSPASQQGAKEAPVLHVKVVGSCIRGLFCMCSSTNSIPSHEFVEHVHIGGQLIRWNSVFFICFVGRDSFVLDWDQGLIVLEVNCCVSIWVLKLIVLEIICSSCFRCQWVLKLTEVCVYTCLTVSVHYSLSSLVSEFHKSCCILQFYGN